MRWHGLPSALLMLLLLGILAVADSQKEFADCGSTALMPVKLELDPDPAEVSARARAPRPHSLAATGCAVGSRLLSSAQGSSASSRHLGSVSHRSWCRAPERCWWLPSSVWLTRGACIVVLLRRRASR
eukprot:COSAG02_NODE_355_length_24011_cov_28.560932_2_plen_128_part_00